MDCLYDNCIHCSPRIPAHGESEAPPAHEDSVQPEREGEGGNVSYSTLTGSSHLPRYSHQRKGIPSAAGSSKNNLQAQQ